MLGIVFDLIGWCGAALILFAYALVSFSALKTNSLVFQGLNVVGALGVVFNAYHHGAIPSVVLNVAWIVVGTAVLLRLPVPPARRQTPSLPAPKKFEPPEDKIILSERGRTIDQIKRIYAVVMGFAATECLKNIIAGIRDFHSDIATFTFMTFGLCFVSLMILFYLASERFLDTRYLQVDSRRATRLGLVFDLSCLFSTAGVFVLISQALPISTIAETAALAKTSTNAEPLVQNALSTFTADFMKYVAILYILDVIFLMLQIVRMILPDPISSMNKEVQSDAIKVHLIWIGINALSLFALFALQEQGVTDIQIQINLALLALHGVRFIVDFGFTFRFYYPKHRLTHETASQPT